jgi:uncharacterized protein
VRISNRLREKYPQEMTIVLQHQFWDLNVTDHTFEIGLSFSGVPERLLIPFDALTGFFDPSVQFGLKFDTQNEDDEEVAETLPVPQPVGNSDSAPVEMKQPRKSSTEKKTDPKKAPLPVAKTQSAQSGTGQGSKPETEEPTNPPGSADVVSLDAFRKKS